MSNYMLSLWKGIKMFKYKKWGIVISLVLSLLAIIGLIKKSQVIAEDSFTPMSPDELEVMCYDIQVIDPTIPDINALKRELNEVETLYKNNKINIETYEERKKTLEEQIKILSPANEE